jgi:YcaO-like protein with predicted kinase domain
VSMAGILDAPIVDKVFRQGTHRAAAPEQTLSRLQPLLPVMGITRVSDVTGLDCIGVPVAMACRPNARSLAVSQGKGLDLLAAKVSAIMEAAESWHAERIIQPLILATVNELRYTKRIIDVAALPRRSGGALHDDLRILWIEGRDARSGEPIWLPFEVVHTNFSLPLATSSGALLASSNGLASGTHLIEAVSHAICEVVERDAVTLWRALDANQRERRRVDLRTVDDEGCRSVLERFASAGVSVAVWDATSDIGLPVFRCAIADTNPNPMRSHLPGIGCGCHPARAVAMLRALTEAAQARLTLITGARDDMGVAHYVRSRDPAAQQRLQAEMRPGPGPRAFGAAPTFDGATINDDVRWELTKLEAVGIEQVVIVDLTKDRLQIPVARVVIPHLEGVSDAPGYRPGARLVRVLQEPRA